EDLRHNYGTCQVTGVSRVSVLAMSSFLVQILVCDRIFGRDRTLLPVRLRYISPPRRQRPIGPALDSPVQIVKPALEIRLVVLPSHAVYTRRGVTLKLEECVPKQIDADVVQQRNEPLLLPPLATSRTRLSACDSLSGAARPARALPTRVPLALRLALCVG